MRLVSHLGSFPAATRVVHVGDPLADIFGFFEACQSTKTQFLVRVARNRRIAPEEANQHYLMEQIRALPATSSRPFHVSATHGQTARMTVVHLAFGQVTILPPRASEALRH